MEQGPESGVIRSGKRHGQARSNVAYCCGHLDHPWHAVCLWLYETQSAGCFGAYSPGNEKDAAGPSLSCPTRPERISSSTVHFGQQPHQPSVADPKTPSWGGGGTCPQLQILKPPDLETVLTQDYGPKLEDGTSALSTSPAAARALRMLAGHV